MRPAVLHMAMCCLVMLLPGCGSDAPLIFGKVDTLGVSASVTAPDQGGNVALGYRSVKAAIVPVTTRDAYGNVIVLKENRLGTSDGGFSTFAHFEATAGAAAGANACLGDTFATGLAAQAVAQRIDRVCR
jgi:hypothetical protein